MPELDVGLLANIGQNYNPVGTAQKAYQLKDMLTQEQLNEASLKQTLDTQKKNTEVQNLFKSGDPETKKPWDPTNPVSMQKFSQYATKITGDPQYGMGILKSSQDIYSGQQAIQLNNMRLMQTNLEAMGNAMGGVLQTVAKLKSQGLTDQAIAARIKPEMVREVQALIQNGHLSRDGVNRVSQLITNPNPIPQLMGLYSQNKDQQNVTKLQIAQQEANTKQQHEKAWEGMMGSGGGTISTAPVTPARISDVGDKISKIIPGFNPEVLSQATPAQLSALENASPDDILYASQVASGKTPPPTVSARSPQARRQTEAIMNVASALNPSFNPSAVKAERTSATGALTKTQEQFTVMKQNAQTAQQYGTNLLKSSQDLLMGNPTLSKLNMERIRNFGTDAQKSQLAQFDQFKTSLIGDYAKVIEGATGAAGASDSTMNRNVSTLNAAQTPAALKGAIDAINTDIETRLKVGQSTINQATQNVENVGQSTAKASVSNTVDWNSLPP